MFYRTCTLVCFDYYYYITYFELTVKLCNYVKSFSETTLIFIIRSTLMALTVPSSL